MRTDQSPAPTLPCIIEFAPLQRAGLMDIMSRMELMLSLADAGGRIMYSLKDLAELATPSTHEALRLRRPAVRREKL